MELFARQQLVHRVKLLLTIEVVHTKRWNSRKSIDLLIVGSIRMKKVLTENTHRVNLSQCFMKCDLEEEKGENGHTGWLCKTDTLAGYVKRTHSLVM